MWDRTRKDRRDRKTGDSDRVKPRKLGGEQGKRGLIEVTLTGPQLVEYLRTLDYEAHGGIYRDHADEPLARRMYDAIVPVVDRIEPARHRPRCRACRSMTRWPPAGPPPRRRPPRPGRRLRRAPRRSSHRGEVWVRPSWAEAASAPPSTDPPESWPAARVRRGPARRSVPVGGASVRSGLFELVRPPGEGCLRLVGPVDVGPEEPGGGATLAESAGAFAGRLGRCSARRVRLPARR